MRNCWSVLGIAPTTDKREIKKAYAAKSRECHPSEHPEEYEELKQAYQQACNYVKRHDGTAEKERDERMAFHIGVRELSAEPPKHEPVAFAPEEEHMAFVPDEEQQELDFNVETSPTLGETEDEEREVFSAVQSDETLNWCQRAYMDLFLRQAYLFHRAHTYRDDHWQALCAEIMDRYRKDVKNYPDSKGSVFFPDPNVTNFLLGVLPQMKELDYRAWDVFESYLLPKSRHERSKAHWAAVVDRFLSVRSFKQPGHAYKDYHKTPLPLLRRDLFPWEPKTAGRIEETDRRKRALPWAVLCISFLFIFEMVLFSGHRSNNRPSNSNQEVVNQAIEQYNQEQMQELQEKYHFNELNEPVITPETELAIQHHFVYDGEIYFMFYEDETYYCVQGSGVEEGERSKYTAEEFIELHPDAEEAVNEAIASFEEDASKAQAEENRQNAMDQMANPSTDEN